MKVTRALPAAALAAASAAGAAAFVAPGGASAARAARPRQSSPSTPRFLAGEPGESAFVADAAPVAEGEGEEDKAFDAVEKMGRGAAKVR